MKGSSEVRYGRKATGFGRTWRTFLANRDVVFLKQKVVVFCDGDFWHGWNWRERKAKLRTGANPSYWIAKIERNIQRDKRVNADLTAQGFKVLRFWEREILSEIEKCVEKVVDVVSQRVKSSL